MKKTSMGIPPDPGTLPMALPTMVDAAGRNPGSPLEGMTAISLVLGRGGEGGLGFVVGGGRTTRILRIPAPPVDGNAPLPVVGEAGNEHLAAVAAELLRALAPHLMEGFVERLSVPPRIGALTVERLQFLAELRAHAETPEGAAVAEMLVRHGI